jgi:hypothetical protein
MMMIMIIIIIIIITTTATRDIGTMNSNKRIAATVHSLGTLFVSGIYVQIPYIMEIMTIIIIIILKSVCTPWKHALEWCYSFTHC